jgi:chemotaxis protein CheC
MTEKSSSVIDVGNWSKLAQLGSTNAIAGLSEMLNRDITITALNMEEVSICGASDLIGKADDEVVAIYLLFSGDINGQIMLAFPPNIAYQLIDMTMDVPVGTTTELGEMEQSVLGEVGNVVGSFFLNAIADRVHKCLMPSCPAVMVDMVGAIMGSVMAEALQVNETVYVIRLSFATDDQYLEGKFLAIPTFGQSEADDLDGKGSAL